MTTEAGAGSDGAPAAALTQEMVMERFTNIEKDLENMKMNLTENADTAQVTKRMVREMAERMDTMSAGGDGGENVPIVGKMKKELKEMQEQVQFLFDRPEVNPQVVTDIQEGLKKLEETWMGPEGRGGRDGDYPKKKRNWDTRGLKADPYEGNRQEWRSYAFTLKAFIRRESPGLESYMVESE